ncbi:hypothetical protein [Actinocrispum sp. NPDC049592]|uniref:hypothetical protein n=1 Tax=Actinocrispum sp. NPDC049592 TaxID=3154835 RepID=UPI00343D5B36
MIEKQYAATPAAPSMELISTGVQRSTILNTFMPYLKKRWAEGCVNAAALHAEITAQGFRGSAQTVRRHLQHWPTLLAHATAQQAFILIDLGEITGAVELLSAARAVAEHSAPPLLRAWLAAAHGEGLAAAGRRDDAFRAFDAADALVPPDPVDPALPYLFLADAHLARWRGHALARLGEPDAIDQLSHSLPRLPKEFVRAKTGMLVDLAFAYAAAGDRDAALAYAREAKRFANQIKSDRQRRRLSGLILPGSVSVA